MEHGLSSPKEQTRRGVACDMSLGLGGAISCLPGFSFGLSTVLAGDSGMTSPLRGLCSVPCPATDSLSDLGQVI